LTLINAINDASAKLAAAGILNARLDAEVLLRHTLGRDRAWLLAHIQDALDEERYGFFQQHIARRCRREPLQYITGRQEFWGLEFLVTPDVLIPRPETELIIEAALGSAPMRTRPLTIVDVCTGSGCVAVCLAKELPEVRVFATDSSAKTLEIARENARRHGVGDRIRFLEGDLFEPLEELDLSGRVDIIVANPPYVPSGARGALQPEVRDYEPALALFAGPDGTEIHRRIIGGSPHLLKGNGPLIMEMGLGQAEMLVRMTRESNAFADPAILKDLAGIERVIVARKK
jgi:release factor glutamine methyltransferase